jgi:hypothetical protein
VEGGADDRNHGDKTPKREGGDSATRQNPDTQGGQVTKSLHELAVETDTSLEQIYHKLQKIASYLESVERSLHEHAGDVGQGYGRDKRFKKSLEECIAVVEAGDSYYAKQSLESYRKLEAERLVLLSEQDALEAIWREHRWSRFFLVLNSNGHIHSSLSCSTCYWTTQYGWLPRLSGLSEADAVAQEGEILCSICFPSAPVSWTNGASRRDKDAKAKREAEKAERLAKKAEKSLSADGSVVTIRGKWVKDFKTLRSAEIWLVEALAWAKIGKDEGKKTHNTWLREPDGFTDANLELVLDLIAKKKGVTVEEVKAENVDKVAKKIASESRV